MAGGLAGAGIANRMQRPATLPGLGDRRPSQLPTNERVQNLSDRMAGDRGFRDQAERPDQRPARDWNQTREDWQSHRDEMRNDWQEHRDQARDDWQDWRDDHYPWHGGWYWGNAPGYWGSWDHLWDEHPVAAVAGLTWWGVNTLGYAFGCDDYSNPYYSESYAVDYSEPIVTAPEEYYAPAESAPQQEPSQTAVQKFDEGRAAFYEGNYNAALKLVDEATKQLPHDAVLHEFRSLVLFALRRYGESAAAIHAVLAVGPGWDWKTLSSLYPDVEKYTAHLRALEAYCTQNAKAADGQFLLGYHYLTTGVTDAALARFRRANELQPNDSVSANLVASLTPRDLTAKPSAAEPAAAAPKAVPPEEVVGAWTASGKGSAKYAMTLDKEGTFSWKFTRGKRTEEVKGVYTVDGNVLAMEPNGGGTMVAELTMKAPNQLHFQMVGAATNDPGLNFEK